ncbi:MAG TPA: alpha/beta hydrolase-fold protein, partial [Caulobacter sp.]|nr:alpha/beta hydrolase-fold protein [Caulobacter sp.]
MKTRWACVAMAVLLASLGAASQAASPALSTAPIAAVDRSVTVERIKVHGVALEGNLEGEATDRDVVVYLPPGYATDTARHYPVVYALHGYGLTVDGFAGLLQAPQTVEGAFAAGAPDMIVVLPDTQTLHNGSMYS